MNSHEEKEAKNELKTKGLDIRRMRTMMLESFPKVKLAEEKDLVLVVGNTGAGKSTTVNYLLGAQLAEKEVDVGYVVDLDEKETQAEKYAKIGHTPLSETFVPTMYKGNKFNYLDCPGFLENRDLESGVCTSINTRSAIKLARSIKSIMVVIDINSFYSERSYGIKKLGRTLGTLLKNPKNQADSICFVITKNESRKTITHIKAKIEELIQSSSKRYTELLNNSNLDEDGVNEKNEIDGMLKIFDLMKNNPKNIFLADIFTGNTKNQIENFINASRIVSKDQFAYVPRDEAYVQFEEIMFSVMREWTGWIGERAARLLELAENEARKTDITAQKEDYEAQIDDIRAGRLNTQQTIARETAKIATNTATIARHQATKLSAEQAKQTAIVGKAAKEQFLTEEEIHLRDERNIDMTRVDEPSAANGNHHVHYHDSFHHNYNGIPLSNIVVEAPFNTHETWLTEAKARFAHKTNWTWEMSDIMKSNCRGRYDVINADKNKGVYTAHYNSGLGFKGTVKIHYYALRKNMAQYAGALDSFNRTISQKENEITGLNADIARLNNENTVSQGIIDVANGRSEGLTATIPNLERIVREYTAQIAALELLIRNMRNEIGDLKNSIDGSLDLCRVVADILRSLEYDLNEDVIKKFLDFVQARDENVVNLTVNIPATLFHHAPGAPQTPPPAYDAEEKHINIEPF